MNTAIRTVLLGALFVFSPLCGVQTANAQTSISPPVGWKMQAKANGAQTFSPPDLRAGEVYNITIYESAPLNGKTLEEYLRAFAGPVSKKPGQLSAPLQISSSDARGASGIGIYAGPNGTQLVAAFAAFSFDGGRNLRVARTLASGDAVFIRYKDSYQALLGAMAERAQAEAGDKLVRVPARVAQKLKLGGDLVPGIYVGEQHLGQQLQYRLRVYLYPSGEYRFKNQNNESFKDNHGTALGVGTCSYNRNSGQLDLDFGFDMTNDHGSLDKTNFCFYGRNIAGKPAIYAEKDLGFHTARTSLVWVAPLDKNSSPSVIKARQDAAAAEAARYKFVVAPGRGVKPAQIHALLHQYEFRHDPFAGSNVTDQAYLLLKDGTVHEGLPVPPDQLDVAASRRGEPKAWGRWTRKGDQYRVSWNGKPLEDLPGNPVLPGAPQLRLQGRYAAVRAGFNWHRFWGVTFDKAGRFSKDRRGAVTTGNVPIEGGFVPNVTTTYDNGGSATTVTGGGVAASAINRRNPNGDREGTYSINGYTLTLRYDNGQIARMPFFFDGPDRKQLWFESDTLTLGLDD